MRFRHPGGGKGKRPRPAKAGRGLHARPGSDDDDDDDEDEDDDDADDADDDADEDDDADDDADDADDADDEDADDDEEESVRARAPRRASGGARRPSRAGAKANKSSKTRKKPESPGGKQLQKAGFRVLSEILPDTGQGKPKWFEVEGERGNALVLRQTPHLWHAFGASSHKLAEDVDDLFDSKSFPVEELEMKERGKLLRELIKAPESVMLSGRGGFNRAVVQELLAQRMERSRKKPGRR